MDDLRKLWVLVKADLTRARCMLPERTESDGMLALYREYVEQNELEFACYELENYAEHYPVPSEYWSALADAAAKMKLPEQVRLYKQRSSKPDNIER